jgi:hypothetical protein
MRHELRWSSRMTLMTLRLRSWTSPIVTVLRAAVFRPVPAFDERLARGQNQAARDDRSHSLRPGPHRCSPVRSSWVMCQIADSSACRHDG